MSTKNGKKSSKNPTRKSDGRTFVTVYLTEKQHKLLEQYTEPLGIGISTFLRSKGLEAVTAAK